MQAWFKLEQQIQVAEALEAVVQEHGGKAVLAVQE
jgi:hypothetical protein